MTAPNRRPSVEGALGNHEKRIGTLESIAPPGAGAAQWIQIGWPPGPVVSNQGLSQRYPGGWRVMSAYPWGVNGQLDTTEVSWAKDAWKEDQQAANYAAADSTLEFTPEQAGIDTTGNTGGKYVTGYKVYCTFRPDASYGAATVGHITINNAYNPNGDGDIDLLSFPSARYSLWPFDSAGADERFFEAGETITVKAFHTDAAANFINLDQIYFVPVFNIYTGMLGGGTAKATITTSVIASSAALGPTAATAADATFGGQNVVKDTQAIDSLWDTTMTFSFWAYTPGYGGSEVDFDRRHLRHNYISARLNATVDTPDTYATFITQMTNTGQPVSCWVPSTNGGMYYLGPVAMDLTPPQYVLWQAGAETNLVPFEWGDNTSGVVTDVRVHENFFSSSYLDDETSKVYPPVYP